MSGANDNAGPRGMWAWWPLRLVLFFVVLAALDIACQFGRAWLVKYPHGIPKYAIQLGEGLLIAAVMVVAYRVLVRLTERRDATELDAARAIPLTAGGVLLGVLLFCVVYAALWSLGIATFLGWGTTDGLLATFAGAMGAAFGEEIVFRGSLYRLLEEGFGTTAAVLVSGALFGLLHAGNPGATAASSAAIALEAGILLAAAYAATRSLWLPIGLHFGWNFTEGGIFGASVSGGESHGLLNVHLAGPEALTGGQFGPEASLVAVAVSLAISFVMLVMTVRRGRWKPMRLRLRSAGEA